MHVPVWLHMKRPGLFISRSFKVVIWSAILGGCALNGHGKEALKYFEQMCEECVQSDDVHFYWSSVSL
jgi:pentatricopeptide repeat protein